MTLSSTPSGDVTIPPSAGLTTGVLPIQTTQEIGLNAPLGLVINEMRTSPNQSLVFDSTGAAFLESPIEPGPNVEYPLEAAAVREALRLGFTPELSTEVLNPKT